MNEVRSTNELAAVKQRARDQTNDRATSRSQRDKEQASLMGCVMHQPCMTFVRRLLMAWPAAGAARSRVCPRVTSGELGGESKRFGGQATKSIRWMPWHQEAMKDVVKLRKATVSRIQALTRRSPNRETDIELCRCGSWLNT
jgi:hypothetical protein